MIIFLDGKLEFAGEKFTVINVGGIGYKVFTAASALKKLPEKGAAFKLWTHLHVKEDCLELYGFLLFSELDLFEILIKVPGIGPKIALGVIDVAPIDALRSAIAAGDLVYLTKVSGIGRKTAEKIVLELKEKMTGGAGSGTYELKEETEALEALSALGYSPKEAAEALKQIPPEIKSPEKRVKEALRRLGAGNRRWLQ